MIALGAIAIGWFFSRLVLRGVFEIAARSTDLAGQVKTAKAKTPAIDARLPIEERQNELDLIDASLEEPRSRIRL